MRQLSVLCSADYMIGHSQTKLVILSYLSSSVTSSDTRIVADIARKITFCHIYDVLLDFFKVNPYSLFSNYHLCLNSGVNESVHVFLA